MTRHLTGCRQGNLRRQRILERMRIRGLLVAALVAALAVTVPSLASPPLPTPPTLPAVPAVAGHVDLVGDVARLLPAASTTLRGTVQLPPGAYDLDVSVPVNK